jgi:hypothetical protein
MRCHARRAAASRPLSGTGLRQEVAVMAIRRIIVGLVVSVFLSAMVASSVHAAPSDREAALRAKGRSSPCHLAVARRQARC